MEKTSKKIFLIFISLIILIPILNSQKSDELSFAQLAKAIDEAAAKNEVIIRSFMMKEDEIINFYVDCQVKEFKKIPSFVDYKIINTIAISVGVIMNKDSFKANKLWLLKNGEKKAWIYANDCKKILSIKDKKEATNYLFKNLNIIESEQPRK